MTVVAITMVRDEADIIARTVGHMASRVDHVLVADNGSTDGTREILEQLDGVTVLDDPEPGYFQSRKMTALAERARGEYGAEWIIPFDADEIWRAADGLRNTLGQLDPAVLVCEAPLFDHVATGEDPDETDPVLRLGWRRIEQAPLRKVAVRARHGLVIHQGNHSASFEGVNHPPTVTNALEVRHFPYRSAEQMVRKARNGAAAYAATDLPESVGGHWRGYGRILAEQGEAGIHEVFERWFWRERPSEPLLIEGERQPPLVYDPALS